MKTIMYDLNAAGITMDQARNLAQDRKEWWKMVLVMNFVKGYMHEGNHEDKASGQPVKAPTVYV